MFPSIRDEYTCLNSAKQKWFCPILRESTQFNLLILPRNSTKYDKNAKRTTTICQHIVWPNKPTELRVKKVHGTPSSVFHILAEPSVDDETKYSESKL